MSENTIKIRLKIGQLEVEYEGDVSFTKNDLSNLVDTILGYYKQHETVLSNDLPSDYKGSGKSSDINHKTELSIKTIASRLKVKTGPDLVMAATGYLTLVKNKDVFTRGEIIEEMKKANPFYKQSHLKNLTGSINSLIKKGCLNETAKDSYSLTLQEKETMESKLAQDLRP